MARHGLDDVHGVDVLPVDGLGLGQHGIGHHVSQLAQERWIRSIAPQRGTALV